MLKKNNMLTYCLIIIFTLSMLILTVSSNSLVSANPAKPDVSSLQNHITPTSTRFLQWDAGGHNGIIYTAPSDENSGATLESTAAVTTGARVLINNQSEIYSDTVIHTFDVKMDAVNTNHWYIFVFRADPLTESFMAFVFRRNSAQRSIFSYDVNADYKWASFNSSFPHPTNPDIRYTLSSSSTIPIDTVLNVTIKSSKNRVDVWYGSTPVYTQSNIALELPPATGIMSWKNADIYMTPKFENVKMYDTDVKFSMADDKAVYDGTEIAAPVTATHFGNAYPSANLKLEYKLASQPDSEFSVQKPVNPGEYKVRATVDSAKDIANFGKKVFDFVIIDKDKNILIGLNNRTVNVTNVNFNKFQFWVKEAVSGVEKPIWVLKSSFEDDNTFFSIPDAFENDSVLEVIVRAKALDGTINDYFKTFRQEDYETKLDIITANGKRYNSNETLYLPKSGATLGVEFFGVQPDTVQITNGTYTAGTFVLSPFDITGKITLEVQMNGYTEYINAEIFDDSSDYAYIKEITFDDKTIIPVIEAVNGADLAGYTVTVSIAGNTYTVNNFEQGVEVPNLVKGYYYYSVTLRKDNNIVDTYKAYYKYGNYVENLLPSFAPITANINEQISIDFTLEEGYTYQVYRWDINGERLIKSYINTGTDTTPFNLSLSRAGYYRFIVRVKPIGSNCSFEQERSVFVTVGTTTERLFEIDADDTMTARTINYINITNNDEEFETVYRYIVRAPGLYEPTEYFVPGGTFTFIPNKKGTYIIEVRALSTESFGFTDYTATKTITVI